DMQFHENDTTPAMLVSHAGTGVGSRVVPIFEGVAQPAIDLRDYAVILRGDRFVPFRQVEPDPQDEHFGAFVAVGLDMGRLLADLPALPGVPLHRGELTVLEERPDWPEMDREARGLEGDVSRDNDDYADALREVLDRADDPDVVADLLSLTLRQSNVVALHSGTRWTSPPRSVRSILNDDGWFD
ncbi:MAG: hypothetical protein AAF602_23750, partial [Myxococcota bacterium]